MSHSAHIIAHCNSARQTQDSNARGPFPRSHNRSGDDSGNWIASLEAALPTATGHALDFSYSPRRNIALRVSCDMSPL